MKVQELIRELSKCNPVNDVLIVAEESGSFHIVNVSKDDDTVYIIGEWAE